MRNAIEAGKRQPPVDLRGLKSEAICKDQSGDSVRARVITFLEQVYNSQAETLPDTRDDAADESFGVFVRDFAWKDDAKDVAEDPYADALVAPEQSRAPTPKLRRLRKYLVDIISGKLFLFWNPSSQFGFKLPWCLHQIHCRRTTILGALHVPCGHYQACVP